MAEIICNRAKLVETMPHKVDDVKCGIIAQGAEAVLKRDGDILIKDRVKKSYRIDVLDDELRKQRTKTEERIMRSAKRCGVAVPQILDADETTVKMEFISGQKLRDILDDNVELADKIGENIAKLHASNIIHGDLTTSNMILHNNDVFFIDFGLAFMSTKEEDKAVDLQLLKQALTSTHERADEAWEKVLKAYADNYNQGAGVLHRLALIEKRGRYKDRHG
ncbi:MAG: KEOPS complex kinase/ATPase Bud32 [Candidatus Aenigmatarchaeota archaeon]